jgi:hypothetical protein
VVSLLWVTYPNESGGLIMMGDLPDEEKMWLTWQKDLAGEVLTG